jgi:hypothetical protein
MHVLCTLYLVLCTLYLVLCTLYLVLCTLYLVLCTILMHHAPCSNPVHLESRMNVRFTIAFSLVSIVLGYIVFFAVSEIPMIEYFSLALSGLLVQLGVAITVRHEPTSVILRGLVNLTMVATGYYLWGWSMLWGGLAMAGVGLCMAAVYGLLYWYAQRAEQF